MPPASAAQVVFRLTDRLFRASDEDQVYIALHEVATGEAHIAFSPEGVEANISTPIERRFVDQWEG